MFVFRKIWRALFSSYLRFEIRPFALSPTSCYNCVSIICQKMFVVLVYINKSEYCQSHYLWSYVNILSLIKVRKEDKLNNLLDLVLGSRDVK